MWNGFGNALAQAVEFVMTPLLFGLLGAWLDGRFGTRPVLMLALGAIGLVGVVLRAYYAYQAAITREEE